MKQENWARIPFDAAHILPDSEVDRVPLTLATTLRVEGAEPVPVLLRDISSGGFLAEFASDVPVGSIVELHLPLAGSARAKVAWAKAGRIGGQFLHPLEAFRLETLSRA